MRIECYRIVVVDGERVDYRYDAETDTLILSEDMRPDDAAKIAADIQAEKLSLNPTLIVS